MIVAGGVDPIPAWLATGATVLFAVIGGVHLWHLLTPDGRHRSWHVLHVVMAVGMVAMLAPIGVPAAAGALAYGLAAVALGVGLVRERAYRRPVGLLRLAAVADLCAMSYMFLMMSHRLASFTLLLVVWLVLQGLSWAAGHAYPARLRALLPEGDWCTPTVRVSVCAMCLAMAAMLAFMQWGPAAVTDPRPGAPSGPGMPGMPGM